MPIDPLTGGLVKFALDQIARRLPSASSQTRILEVLRQTAGLRIAGLDARLARLEGD